MVNPNNGLTVANLLDAQTELLRYTTPVIETAGINAATWMQIQGGIAVTTTPWSTGTANTLTPEFTVAGENYVYSGSNTLYEALKPKRDISSFRKYLKSEGIIK